eukprot:4245305-Alexandrium_andersonii.AAC.1
MAMITMMNKTTLAVARADGSHYGAADRRGTVTEGGKGKGVSTRGGPRRIRAAKLESRWEATCAPYS